MIQTIEELDYGMMKDRVYRRYSRVKRERGELTDLEDCFHDTWESLLVSGIPDGLSAISCFMARFRQLNYDRYIRNRNGFTFVSDATHDEADSIYGEDMSIGMEVPPEIDNRSIRNTLSFREWEVYSLLTGSKEFTQKEVALVLGVTPQAVSSYLKRIGDKIRGIGMGVLKEYL